MKTFRVKLTEVYIVEAESEEEAMELASTEHYENGEGLTGEQKGRIDYQHGDDSAEEV